MLLGFDMSGLGSGRGGGASSVLAVEVRLQVVVGGLGWLEAEDPKRNPCPSDGQDQRHPAGAFDFLGSFVKGSSPHQVSLPPRETSDPQDPTTKASQRLSPRWWHGLGVGFDLGYGGWLVLRRLAWRSCGQFGNSDASSRAWVAAWALLGCYRRVRWVLSCFNVSL
jgi:hypothetical protein